MEQENPEGYFPISSYLGIIDVVLGTHVFGSFLAYLAFNKYILEPLIIVKFTGYPVINVFESYEFAQLVGERQVHVGLSWQIFYWNF